MDIPAYLKQSIISKKEVKTAVSPIGFVKPVIDGKITHYYEWDEAGAFHVKDESFGSMHKGKEYIKSIFYGFNLKNLYIRIDPSEEIDISSDEIKELEAHVIFNRPREYKIVFPMYLKNEKKYFLFESRKKMTYDLINKSNAICFEKIYELSIPFKQLGLKADAKVMFHLEIMKDNITLDVYPREGCLSFDVPGTDFEMKMWSV
jgi:hypothetical protein